jgi:hypothetical protein
VSTTVKLSPMAGRPKVLRKSSRGLVPVSLQGLIDGVCFSSKHVAQDGKYLVDLTPSFCLLDPADRVFSRWGNPNCLHYLFRQRRQQKVDSAQGAAPAEAVL